VRLHYFDHVAGLDPVGTLGEGHDLALSDEAVATIHEGVKGQDLH